MEFDDPIENITVPANRTPLTFWDRYKMGALNPVYGAAQSYMHLRYPSDSSNAMVANQLDKDITERQQIYDAQRKAAGQTGPDFWKELGEKSVLAPMNLATARGGPLGSAAWESAKTLLEPEVNANPRDFWQKKREDILINAGGALAEEFLPEMWKKAR
jgi:hypothetical protein